MEILKFALVVFLVGIVAQTMGLEISDEIQFLGICIIAAGCIAHNKDGRKDE